MYLKITITINISRQYKESRVYINIERKFTYLNYVRLNY